MHLRVHLIECLLKAPQPHDQELLLPNREPIQFVFLLCSDTMVSIALLILLTAGKIVKTWYESNISYVDTWTNGPMTPLVLHLFVLTRTPCLQIPQA